MRPDADDLSRYHDLLGGEADARLAAVAEDLDALYAVAPPRDLASRVQQAIQQAGAARRAEDPAHAFPAGAGAGPRSPRSPRGSGAAGAAAGSRASWRWQTLLATAAAFMVVALMAALLTSLGHGPSSGAVHDVFDQRFAQTGGVRIVAVPSCAGHAGDCGARASLVSDVGVIQARLAYGLPGSDAEVQLQGDNSIRVEVAGVTDTAAVTTLLAQGCLDLLDASAPLPVGTMIPAQRALYTVVLACASPDPHTVSARVDPQTQAPVVTFTLRSADQEQFATYTRTHIGDYLTVTLDGRVIESAVIQSEISGAVAINGLPSLVAARTVAGLLAGGALPTPLAVASAQAISASGGAQPTQTSASAGTSGQLAPGSRRAQAIAPG